MKQKDLTLILVVGIVSATLSFIVSNSLFKVPKNQDQKVEVVEPITAEFQEHDKRFFNENSVNPTQLIEIKGNNTKPFN